MYSNVRFSHKELSHYLRGHFNMAKSAFIVSVIAFLVIALWGYILMATQTFPVDGAVRVVAGVVLWVGAVIYARVIMEPRLGVYLHLRLLKKAADKASQKVISPLYAVNEDRLLFFPDYLDLEGYEAIRLRCTIPVALIHEVVMTPFGVSPEDAPTYQLSVATRDATQGLLFTLCEGVILSEPDSLMLRREMQNLGVQVEILAS